MPGHAKDRPKQHCTHNRENESRMSVPLLGLPRDPGPNHTAKTNHTRLIFSSSCHTNDDPTSWSRADRSNTRTYTYAQRQFERVYY